MSEILDSFLSSHESDNESSKQSFDTPVPSDRVPEFEQWVKQYAPSQDSGDYDYGGAFLAGSLPDQNGHWTDTFKKPNHPTFSDESQYAKYAPDKAGHWEGDTFVPPKSKTLSLQKYDAPGLQFEEPKSNLDDFIKQYGPAADQENRQRAEQLLSAYTSDQIDLTPEQHRELTERAQQGVTPVTTLKNTALGITDALYGGAFPGAKLVKGVYETGKKGAQTLYKAGRDFVGSLEESPEDKTNPIASAVAGLASAPVDVVNFAQSLGTGAVNLADMPFPGSEERRIGRILASEDAQRLLSQTTKGIHEELGTSESEPISEVTRFAGQAALPIGAEGELAGTGAKLADALVERAPGAALKTAKVVPAVTGAGLMATGHTTLGAEIIAAGYGVPIGYHGLRGLIKRVVNLATDDSPKSASEFSQVIDAINNAPHQTPIYTYIKQGIDDEVSRLQQVEMKLRKQYEGKLQNVDDSTFKMSDLKGPDAEVRSKMDQIADLQKKSQGVSLKSDLNKVLSYYGKVGIGTAFNLGVGGTTIAGISASQAQPSQVRESAEHGFITGVTLASPFAPKIADTAQKTLKIERGNEALIDAGKKHLESQGQVLPEGLDPNIANQVYMDAGKASALGSKIELHPASELPDVNGYYDKKTDTIHLNSDKLASGVSSHEVFHPIQEALQFKQSEFGKDLINRIKSPDMQSGLAFSNFKRNYAKALESADPEAFSKLTPEKLAEEATAELARLVSSQMPSGAFYRGKSGADVMSDWISRAADFINPSRNKEINLVPGFDAPYTAKDLRAVKDMLFDVGERQARGQKYVRQEPAKSESAKEEQAPATPEPEINAETRDQAVAAMKALKIVDPVAKVESVMKELGPDATLEDVVRKATQRAVPKDLSDVSLMPASKSETIDRPASKISDLIFPGTPRQAKVAAKKYGLDKVAIDETHRPGFLTVGGAWKTPEEARIFGEERGQLPESTKNKLTPEDLASERLFMPSDNPRAIKEAAVKTKDGEIINGRYHSDVFNKLGRDPWSRFSYPSGYGFVTNEGEFLSGKDAHTRARELHQLSDEYPKHPAAVTGPNPPLDSVAFRDTRQFMPSPSDHPDALDVPAIKRISDGKVYKAKDAATPHWQMALQNPELKDRYTSGGVDRYIDGWATNSNEFLDKEQGHKRAIEQKQISPNFKTEYKGALSSLDMREGGQFMPSTVNIGLHTNEGGKITPEEALAALRKHGIDVNRFAVHQSDTEPTLVADLSRPLTPEEAHQVSLDLKQEAIAQHANGQGELYGPGADKWKPFNPDYFLNHEGKSLSNASDQPPEGTVNALGSRISRPDLSGVTIQPETTKLDSEPFKGKTIEAGEEPWSIRLKELADKQWENGGLSDKEHEEFTELHKQAEKAYGSYANWWEQSGAEKDYESKVFGEPGQKNVQFMPSSHPDAIKEAAIQTVDGEVFSGKTHFHARDKANHAGLHNLDQISSDGFVTNNGEFLNRDEAEQRAIEMNQFVPQDRDRGFGLEALQLQRGRNFMPAPHIEREAERLGLKYTGEMGDKGKSILLYTDPITKTTIAVKSDAERGELQKKLAAKRDLFKGSLSDVNFMPTLREGFYSPLEKHLEDKMPNKVSPEQLSGILAKSPVKKAELEWTGINDLIGQAKKEGRQISKQEALDYVRANTPEIKEITKSDRDSSLAQQTDERERLREQAEQQFGAKYKESPKYLDSALYEEIGRLTSNINNLATYGDKSGSKYSQYQIPGGSNYRELLMTLPETPSWYAVDKYGNQVGDRQYHTFEDTIKAAGEGGWAQSATKSTQDFKDPHHWDEPNIVGHLRVNDRTLPDGSKMLMAEEMQSGWGQRGRKEGYADETFENRRQEAAKRVEELKQEKGEILSKTTDNLGVRKSGDSYQIMDGTSGKQVVTEGYRDFSSEERARDAIKNLKSQGRANTLTPEQVSRLREINSDLPELEDRARFTGVPDMPFKGEAWKKLLLRNLIRHAVEEGYDSVGWTTGEQQAERYDLSNQIGEITWHKDKTPSGYTNQTKIVALAPDQGSVVMDQTIPNDKLSDFVGKEIADKILQDHGKTLDEKYNASGTISGVDLKVGGEGMKGFYDKELVNLANDIGKKFGAKVTEGNISTEKPFTRNHTATLQTLAADPPNRGLRYQIVDKSTGNVLETFDQSVDAWHKGGPDPDKTSQKAQEALKKYGETVTPETKVWKVDITPEMRESVQAHGQPMFMPSVSDPWSKIHEHLTEEERASIRDRDKQKIIDVFNKLPSIAKGVKTALAGQDARHWYRNSAEAISNTFGPDADRFAALLAALSPQVSVETNLQNAVSVWNAWLKAGKPTDKTSIEDLVSSSVIQGKAAQEKGESSALGAWMNNSIRSLSAEDPRSLKLSGPKVDSFMRNLRDETHEVTNDRWMGKYGLDDPNAMLRGGTRRGPNKTDLIGPTFAGKGFTYLALNAHIRKITQALTKRTGESWTPAETQAAIWSWVKSRADGTEVADVPEFSKLLRDIKPLDKLEPVDESPF